MPEIVDGKARSGNQEKQIALRADANEMKRQRTGLRRTAGGLVSFDLHHKSAEVTIISNLSLKKITRFVERMSLPAKTSFRLPGPLKKNDKNVAKIGIKLMLIHKETMMEAKRREVGNLVLEDVPESVPPHITQRLEQYQNTRGANLHDWHHAAADSADQEEVEGMLISTRFADTTQLHYISRPAGYFFSLPSRLLSPLLQQSSAPHLIF